MKYVRYLFIAIMCLCTSLAKAQNNSDLLEDLVKEKIGALQDTLKAKDALIKQLQKENGDIVKLQKELEKVKAEKAKADSLLAVEKASGKSKEVRDEMDALKKQVKRLQKDSIQLVSRLQNDSAQYVAKLKETLEGQQQACQAQLEQLIRQHQADSVDIADLKQELSGMQGFRKQYIVNLAESVDANWLNKTYSEIDVKQLEKALVQYEEFAQEDVKVADAYEKLKKLLEECEVYQQGVKYVEAPYDAVNVNASLALIKPMRDQATDSRKEEDLQTLYWQLRNYGEIVTYFQEIINEIDNAVKDQDVKKPLVKSVLGKRSDEIADITRIPWLKGQYEGYVDSWHIADKTMEPDYKTIDEIRETIMNLQP